MSNIPHLLTDELGVTDIFTFNPFSQKQFAQERVERFFLAAQFLAAGAVLLVQGAQEPFHHEHGSLLWIGLARRGNEERGVFTPVGRVFSQGGGREDERRGSQGGEVSIERGNRLRRVVIS